MTIPSNWMNTNITSYDWVIQCIDNDTMVVCVGDISLQKDINMCVLDSHGDDLTL